MKLCWKSVKSEWISSGNVKCAEYRVLENWPCEIFIHNLPIVLERLSKFYAFYIY